MQTGLPAAEALSGLDQRSRRIVEARWLRGDGRRATLHALGAQFKVSAECIRQIEEKALERMRAALTPRRISHELTAG